MLAAVAAPVVVLDAAGQIWHANPSAASLLGRPLTDLTGRTWRDLGTSPATAARLDEGRQAVLMTGAPTTLVAPLPGSPPERRATYTLARLAGADNGLDAVVVTLHPLPPDAPWTPEETRLADLFALAPVAIVIRRLDSVIASWNPAAEHLYGWTADEAVGQIAYELLHTQFPLPLKRLEELLIRDGRWDGELRRRRRDGSQVIVATRWALERDADGQPVRVIEITQDITEQRRAEQRFGASVENPMDAFGIHTAVRDAGGQIVDFRIEYVNDAACHINGLTRDQQVGHTLLEILPVHARTGLLDAYRRVVETGTPLMTQVLEHGDESGARCLRRAFDIRAARLGDGVVATWRDVTEQLQAEDERADLLASAQAARREAERAQQRQAFLASASAQLADSLDYAATLGKIARLAVPSFADWCVVDMVDDDGAIQIVAVAHPDPEKEALIHELRRRYPPDPQAPYGLPRVLRAGENAFYPAIPSAWRESAARDAEHLRLMQALDARSSICVPLRARGRILGALTLVLSGSRRQHTEEDLAVAEDLAGRCALALDNAQLFSQVERALRERERFLASAAHDLRNPLTTIRMITQGLRRRLRRVAPPDALSHIENLELVDAAARRMAAIINELLDVARLETGAGLDLSLAETDLVALVSAIVAEHQAATRQRRIHVATTVPELTGLWDAVRLERVLSNLLSNAIKYSPAESLVVVVVGREEHEAVLRVRDQGLGIPAADIPRLFQRFHRGRNVEDSVAGVGLGLWGVRQIVTQHGGTITIESQEGAGTTVTVRLPRSPAGPGEG